MDELDKAIIKTWLEQTVWAIATGLLYERQKKMSSSKYGIEILGYYAGTVVRIDIKGWEQQEVK